MPFGQLSPRKSESRACYLANVAADKRSSGCAWLCHALLLTRLQLNFGVSRTPAAPRLRRYASTLQLCNRFDETFDAMAYVEQDRAKRKIVNIMAPSGVAA